MTMPSPAHPTTPCDPGKGFTSSGPSCHSSNGTRKDHRFGGGGDLAFWATSRGQSGCVAGREWVWQAPPISVPLGP